MAKKIINKILPRFNDTDALGHINNSIYATWFETSRRQIFTYFNPSLDVKKWNLIIARLEIDFLGQGLYQDEVIIETWISRLGTSSFDINHKAIQNGNEIAAGKCIMVYFDYQTEKSIPLTDQLKSELEKHLF